jgi:hypothetical protein
MLCPINPVKRGAIEASRRRPAAPRPRTPRLRKGTKRKSNDSGPKRFNSTEQRRRYPDRHRHKSRTSRPDKRRLPEPHRRALKKNPRL